MISTLRFLSLAIAVCFCGLLGASEETADFYAAEELLSDQSRKQISAGARNALARVLVRMSGNRKLLREPLIRRAMGNADSYIHQYRFIETDLTDLGKSRQRFLFQFDPASVDGLLKTVGLPIWPVNRPVLLVWFVIEDDAGHRFLSDEDRSGVAGAIRTSLKERGLEMQLPLFDLEDNTVVEIADILRADRPSIARGAMRYDANVVLAGRLSQLSSGNWMGDSIYIMNGKSYTVPVEDGDLNSLLDAMSDFVAIFMSAEYALVETGESRAGVELLLDGITQFGEYAAAVTYLESIQAVEYANVEYIGSQKAVFRVLFHGQLQQLKQALDLDGKLELLEMEDTNLPQHYPNIGLAYRWPVSNGAN